MNREIQVKGTENVRTRFVSNRDKGYINGMTDFINVEVPARALVSLKRACEIFDNISEVPELHWLKITDASADLIEDRIVKSEKTLTWGQAVAEMLSEGQVFTYDTPLGQKNLRAKHVYNAVACSLFEESDMTSSSFYGFTFWTNQAKSNFVCRIFFGTSGVYL